MIKKLYNYFKLNKLLLISKSIDNSPYTKLILFIYIYLIYFNMEESKIIIKK